MIASAARVDGRSGDIEGEWWKIQRARIVGFDVGKEEESMWKQEAAKSGVTFGSALAIAISWSVNQSILWAILHGFFSWFYGIYFALTR